MGAGESKSRARPTAPIHVVARPVGGRASGSRTSAGDKCSTPVGGLGAGGEAGEEEGAVDAKHRREVGVGDVEGGADEVVAAVVKGVEDAGNVLGGGPGGDRQVFTGVEDVVDAGL